MTARAILPRTLKYFIATLIGILMIYPVIWLLSSSFKPSTEMFTTGLVIKDFTLSNYLSGWAGLEGVTFGRFFLNSFVIAVLSVFGNVIACSLTAYAFARLEFTGKKLWFAMMIMTLMLPGQVKLIPQYILYHFLGWVNTMLPLVVPHWLAGDSFFILLMVQFMRGVPRELDDSATIDGCNQWQIYYRVMLPLAVPALITTAIFTFYWTWDDFFGQMIYLSGVHQFTVPLGLMSMIDQTGLSNYGGLFAMSVLSLVPVVVLFLFFQKHLVEGIATTGFK